VCVTPALEQMRPATTHACRRRRIRTTRHVTSHSMPQGDITAWLVCRVLLRHAVCHVDGEQPENPGHTCRITGGMRARERRAPCGMGPGTKAQALLLALGIFPEAPCTHHMPWVCLGHPYPWPHMQDCRRRRRTCAVSAMRHGTWHKSHSSATSPGDFPRGAVHAPHALGMPRIPIPLSTHAGLPAATPDMHGERHAAWDQAQKSQHCFQPWD
jgi:hypothetical protein